MSDAPERIWALHYECEDEPDAIAIGYPEKFFGTHEYVRADRINKLEAKLAKCQALMHAGLAEYQRRLVGALEALKDVIGVLDDPHGGEHVKDMREAALIARTVLAELKGELDD
jgi:hypothetical protein